MTLIGLRERKRELEVKRRYAFQRYLEADITARREMRVMQKADKALLEIELELHLMKEATMKSCDQAWEEKNGPRPTI